MNKYVVVRVDAIGRIENLIEELESDARIIFQMKRDLKVMAKYMREEKEKRPNPEYYGPMK